MELYDGSDADAPLIASVTGDITDLSTADTFTSTGEPLRYRCHLGRILLKTAAISLLTGRNLFVRFVTDGGNCERAAPFAWHLADATNDLLAQTDSRARRMTLGSLPSGRFLMTVRRVSTLTWSRTRPSALTTTSRCSG